MPTFPTALRLATFIFPTLILRILIIFLVVAAVLAVFFFILISIVILLLFFFCFSCVTIIILLSLIMLVFLPLITLASSSLALPAALESKSLCTRHPTCPSSTTSVTTALLPDIRVRSAQRGSIVGHLYTALFTHAHLIAHWRRSRHTRWSCRPCISITTPDPATPDNGSGGGDGSSTRGASTSSR